MISTHVLDIARGIPAAGLDVLLDVRRGAEWTVVGRGTTDAQGRIAGFASAALTSGTYRLTFATGAYHRGAGVQPFFPDVVVAFEVEDDAHYHVPLLLSP